VTGMAFSSSQQAMVSLVDRLVLVVERWPVSVGWRLPSISNFGSSGIAGELLMP
jgi:hypothetical protein